MTGLRVIEGGSTSGTDIGVATYIWLDRHCNICSRTKVISVAKGANGDVVPILNRWKMVEAVELPEGKDVAWRERMNLQTKTFILTPCNYTRDPLRSQPSFIVLCEVRGLDDIPDPWNARARLRKLVEGKDMMPGDDPEETPAGLLGTWWGIQQHFHSLRGNEESINTDIREKFLLSCVDAGLRIHSASNKHYWLGPRNITDDIDVEEPGPLVIADHTILARFLYERLLFEQGFSRDTIHMPCSIYLSTEELRTNPDAVGNLTIILDGLKKDHPTRLYIPALNEEGETYRAMVNKLRPSIHWEARLSVGLAINTGGPNYFRIAGAPGNVDPYEAMFRIFEVLLAAQEEPSENPAPEGV